ncbi:class I SAM-dependent methyltransferase [Fibrobacterota bacterium]
MEKQRLENVYGGYRHSRPKAESWKDSPAKGLTWKQVFSLIERETDSYPKKKRSLRILEVGSYAGNILYRMSALFPDARLYGLDIRQDPLRQGRKNLPGVHFVCGDGADLPFAAGTFDIVIQFVCLSSVLDVNIRKSICREMFDVLRPGGTLISLDMRYWSPNENVVSIGRTELKQNFRGASAVSFFPVWLLPPLQRRVANPWLLKMLYALSLLRSHWLCFIRK